MYFVSETDVYLKTRACDLQDIIRYQVLMCWQEETTYLVHTATVLLVEFFVVTDQYYPIHYNLMSVLSMRCQSLRNKLNLHSS